MKTRKRIVFFNSLVTTFLTQLKAQNPLSGIDITINHHPFVYAGEWDLWEAFTGDTQALRSTSSSGRINLPLHLNAHETKFIITGPSSK